MSILVTGTGGGAGQSILKSLQPTDYRVIAADGEVLGTGLYTADKGYVIPYANSSEFVPRLIEICKAERIKLLFAGLDAELPILSVAREAFAEVGVTVVVSEPRVVGVCDDKLETANFLRENGFPFPQTWALIDFPENIMPFPLIIKPKVGGARSKGVRVVKTDAELARARLELDGVEYVAQEMIDGPEFTCGTVTFDGTCQGAITLRRVLRDGDTYKAFVERYVILEEFVTRVANVLKPFGPCNLQLRVRDGVPYVFEFNGRFSGTTYCRALAGFNEPKMIADYLLNGVAPSFAIRPITVLRYWKELVVENDVVNECRHTGIVNERSALL